MVAPAACWSRTTAAERHCVEVALESLLRQWDALALWLREHTAGLKLADNLDRAAADWEHSEHSPEWLIEGVRLATAEELANSLVFRDRLSNAREFLRASREREDAQARAEEQRRESELRAAQQRRRAKVVRAALAVVTVVATVAVAGFVLAFAARSEAVARGRELLAARLTFEAQAMLVGGVPGGELEVIDKLLAAQHISNTRTSAYS